jgi:hypothetical protein
MKKNVKILTPDRPPLLAAVDRIQDLGESCFTGDGTKQEFRQVIKVVPGEITEIHLSGPRPILVAAR